jgi:hypothetical protein
MSFTLRAYLAALLLLSPSCAAAPPDFGPFAPYARSFQVEAALHGKSPAYDGIVMRFQGLPPPFVGYCFEDGVIAVDPHAWAALEEPAREALIFHELGHCVMFLKHRTDKPAVMSPSLLSSAYYARYRSALLNDFFASYE